MKSVFCGRHTQKYKFLCSLVKFLEIAICCIDLVFLKIAETINGSFYTDESSVPNRA